VVPCYDRRDWKRSPAEPLRTPITQGEIDEALAQSSTPPDPLLFAELALALDAVQERGLEAHLYFTPFAIDLNTSKISTKLAVLAYVQERARKFPGRLTLYDFDYPNAVTMECRTLAGPSLYYRPDGHPRPTVGQLIAARLFGQPTPAWADPQVKSDFGVELLAHPDAKGLIVRNARRRAELMAGPR